MKTHIANVSVGLLAVTALLALGAAGLARGRGLEAASEAEAASVLGGQSGGCSPIGLSANTFNCALRMSCNPGPAPCNNPIPETATTANAWTCTDALGYCGSDTYWTGCTSGTGYPN